MMVWSMRMILLGKRESVLSSEIQKQKIKRTVNEIKKGNRNYLAKAITYYRINIIVVS